MRIGGDTQPVTRFADRVRLANTGRVLPLDVHTVGPGPGRIDTPAVAIGLTDVSRRGVTGGIAVRDRRTGPHLRSRR